MGLTNLLGVLEATVTHAWVTMTHPSYNQTKQDAGGARGRGEGRQGTGKTVCSG